MKKEMKTLLAKICTAAVIITTVFPGSVPVMADTQQDEFVLYEDDVNGSFTEDSTDLSEEDIVTMLTGEAKDETVNADDLLSSEDDILTVAEPDTISDEPAAINDSEIIPVVSEDLAEPVKLISDPGDMSIREDETPGDFLSRIIEADGAIPVESVSQNVSSNDFGIVRYQDRISISNNQATVSGNINDLYAVVILSSNEASVKEVFLGVRIEPGRTVSIYQAYGTNGNQSLINSTSDYVVWLGRGFQWTDEQGKEHVEDFGIIGYTADYDENGAPIKDGQGNIIYHEYNILNKAYVGSTNIIKESSSPWKDGYTELKLKAMVQKNMSIKLSWSPNGKDDLQKTFKKYALYELTEDKSSPTGYKETLRWPLKKDGTPADLSGSKSTTLKPGWVNDNETHIVNSSMLYLLKCYDKEGNLKGQYATAVAPYFLQMLSGSRTGEYEFKFTQDKDNSAMYYRLEVAERNAEATDKMPNGYHDEWSVDYCAENLDNLYSIGDYTITTKNRPRAVSMTYNKEDPTAVMGKTYYGRIQTIARLGSLRVISAPSNVLNVKAGPERCLVLDMAGIYYDKADANRKIDKNKANIKRASTHINSFLEGNELTSSNKVYIHTDNKGVDLKSGMIFFIGEDDESNIKSYDLMRSVSENGPYTKIKNYSLTNNMLLKLNVTVEGFNNMNIYAMQYTSFPMEKEYYYTVRAVSKKGGVPGGYYSGMFNKTEMDKVQNFGAEDCDQTKIGLVWEHDDCAKQYWIYRSDTSFPDMSQAPVNEKGKPCPIAKVSAGSFKKTKYFTEDDEEIEVKYHIYYDKKVQTDKKYYYFVRPVYNTKSATNDRKYNMDKCSQEIVGKASAAFATVKTFKASNYEMGKLRLSFVPLKANNENKEPVPTKYRIYRLDVDSSVKKLTDDMKPDIYSKYDPDKETYDQFEDRINKWSETEWDNFFGEKTYSGRKWTRVGDVIHGDGKSTKTVAFNNDTEVGHYYFYLIQFATEKSAGQLFTFTTRVRNVPLPVENVKAEYSGSGSGIRIKWNRNGRDNGKPNLTTWISIDGGYTWKNVGNATEFTDDSLPRGNERNYKILMVYTGTEPKVTSAEASITASLPNKIELSSSEITLSPYQEASFSAKAVRDGGAVASICSIEMGCGSDVIEFKQEGNSGKIRAKRPGTATITVRCAGISRDVKVTVRQ